MSIIGKLVKPVQLRQAPDKFIFIVLVVPRAIGGKLVNPVHPNHVPRKFTPLATLSKGNPDKLVQPRHACSKLETFDVLRIGKVVSPVQPCHAPYSTDVKLPNVSPSDVTFAVFISGNPVRAVQFDHAPLRFVAADIEMTEFSGPMPKFVILSHLAHANVKF